MSDLRADLTTLREALGPFCTRRHDTLGEWSHENCRWCRAIAALARLEAGTWLSAEEAQGILVILRANDLNYAATLLGREDSDQ